MIAEFELRAAEQHVHLQTKPAPEPCWANADPGAVAQIVRILLDNALRVTQSSSSIEVKTLPDQHWPQIQVRDHGPGVPVAERELIFERFSRGTNTGENAGFGLGLAIGRELATRMGGTLRLLDERSACGEACAPARHVAASPPGACFALRLPVAVMNEEATTGRSDSSGCRCRCESWRH